MSDSLSTTRCSESQALHINVGGTSFTVGRRVLEKCWLLSALAVEHGMLSRDRVPEFVYVCPYCGSRSTDFASSTGRRSRLCDCFLPLETTPDGDIFLEYDPSDFSALLTFIRRGVLGDVACGDSSWSKITTIANFLGLTSQPKRCYHCLCVYDEGLNANSPCLRHNGSPEPRSKTDSRCVWSCCQKPCYLQSAFGSVVPASGCIRSAHQSDEDILSVLIQDDMRKGIDVTTALGTPKITDQFTICEQTKSGFCSSEGCGGKCLTPPTAPPVDTERCLSCPFNSVCSKNNVSCLRPDISRPEESEAKKSRKRKKRKGEVGLPQDVLKTRLCPLLRLGVCKESSQSCRYAHCVDDLRYTEEYFKTSMCTFWAKGHCKAGANCRHAHGEAELRRRNDPLTVMSKPSEPDSTPQNPQPYVLYPAYPYPGQYGQFENSYQPVYMMPPGEWSQQPTEWSQQPTEWSQQPTDWSQQPPAHQTTDDE